MPNAEAAPLAGVAVAQSNLIPRSPFRWLTHYESGFMEVDKLGDTNLGVPVENSTKKDTNRYGECWLPDADAEEDLEEPAVKKHSVCESEKEECQRWWLEVLKKASKSKKRLEMLKQRLVDTFHAFDDIEIEEAKCPESRIKLPWE